jgi:16S rRNA (adenine1518-N6/adenine1519-N6)-dimethyltransferase
VRRQLREADARPKKSLGQHFLTDRSVLERIAKSAVSDANTTVIEIGPGLGDLTEELAKRAARVVAVEKDNALAARLRQRFAGTNVRVIHADALELSARRVLELGGVEPPYVITGNLPYNVSQPLLRHYLEGTPQPTDIVVMVQAEVAESMVAGPGKMSLLSISIQVHGEPELLFYVPRTAFHPPPKVRSAVVRIRVVNRPGIDAEELDALFHLARSAFSRRRKQMRNALSSSLGIEPSAILTMLRDARIEATVRPQELTLEQWGALTRVWTVRERAGDGR